MYFGPRAWTATRCAAYEAACLGAPTAAVGAGARRARALGGPEDAEGRQQQADGELQRVLGRAAQRRVDENPRNRAPVRRVTSRGRIRRPAAGRRPAT